MREALERIFRAAAQGTALLSDAHRRPGGRPEDLAPVALDLLLRTLALEAEALAQDPALPADDREALARFARAHRALKQDTVRLEQHLLDLAQGWRCAHCQARVPRGGSVDSPVHPRLELFCLGCGRSTPVTPEGQASFERTFGHLFSPGWDVTRSGLESRTDRR